ncbi:MAG: type II toxin-antitoxin system RelE/ParE family toxin [Verrucomicrobiota bacterium]
MSLLLRESEKSRADLEGIWEYIAFGNPVSGDPLSADRVVDAVARTYKLLTEQPHRTRIKDRDIYRTVVMDYPQYLIIYRFDDEAVEILRVFRGDLDWQRVVENDGL